MLKFHAILFYIFYIILDVFTLFWIFHTAPTLARPGLWLEFGLYLSRPLTQDVHPPPFFSQHGLRGNLPYGARNF